jgi:AGZA family xanthine/uracil permease-like MFS transporter
LARGIPWQQALGMVFVNGVVFLLLSLSGVRERIVRALPASLTLAITAGIGLFIAFIGLRNGGLVVDSPATLVTHGDFTTGSAVLCLFGLATTAILVARRVPAAIVLGIVIATVVGLARARRPRRPPHGVSADAGCRCPRRQRRSVLQLEFAFPPQRGHVLQVLPLILTLLLVDMFDNIGTLVGVARRAGLLDADGNLPRVGRVLVADSLAAILSALLGTSTVVSYVESASGVEAGGRTGLTGTDHGGLLPAGAVLHAAHPGGAGRPPRRRRSSSSACS